MKLRIQVTEGKRQIDEKMDFPECWNDVPASVYPHLAQLYLDPPKGEYHKEIRALVMLLRSGLSCVNLLSASRIFDLVPLVDWVYHRMDLTHNLMPVLNIGGIDFIGPCDEMENLRFAEWCAADTFYINHCQDNDRSHLYKLAAVLYRPAGEGPEFTPGNALYRGDIRQKFNENLLDERAELMAAQPAHIIDGIYLFYASCRFGILKLYPVTFPKEKKASEGDDHSGWLDIYDDLRADNKYIGADRLDEEMLHSVLFSLERSNIKMKKLKESI